MDNNGTGNNQLSDGESLDENYENDDYSDDEKTHIYNSDGGESLGRSDEVDNDNQVQGEDSNESREEKDEVPDEVDDNETENTEQENNNDMVLVEKTKEKLSLSNSVEITQNKPDWADRKKEFVDPEIKKQATKTSEMNQPEWFAKSKRSSEAAKQRSIDMEKINSKKKTEQPLWSQKQLRSTNVQLENKKNISKVNSGHIDYRKQLKNTQN